MAPGSGFIGDSLRFQLASSQTELNMIDLATLLFILFKQDDQSIVSAQKLTSLFCNVLQCLLLRCKVSHTWFISFPQYVNWSSCHISVGCKDVKKCIGSYSEWIRWKTNIKSMLSCLESICVSRNWSVAAKILFGSHFPFLYSANVCFVNLNTMCLT